LSHGLQLNNIEDFRWSEPSVYEGSYEARRPLSPGFDPRPATANQERELRQVAERAGWQIVRVYKDRGISGAKGTRPEFDALHKAAARRECDVVMAWSGQVSKKVRCRAAIGVIGT
jgi:hypothetical protein